MYSKYSPRIPHSGAWKLHRLIVITPTDRCIPPPIIDHNPGDIISYCCTYGCDHVLVVPHHGNCNYERQSDVTFVLYAKHLMSIPRYAAHPSLHFALKAIKDTVAGLGSMRFAVQQSPNEEALVAADLRKLSDDGGKDGAMVCL